MSRLRQRDLDQIALLTRISGPGSEPKVHAVDHPTGRQGHLLLPRGQREPDHRTGRSVGRGAQVGDRHSARSPRHRPNPPPPDK